MALKSYGSLVKNVRRSSGRSASYSRPADEAGTRAAAVGALRRPAALGRVGLDLLGTLLPGAPARDGELHAQKTGAADATSPCPRGRASARWGAPCRNGATPQPAIILLDAGRGLCRRGRMPGRYHDARMAANSATAGGRGVGRASGQAAWWNLVARLPAPTASAAEVHAPGVEYACWVAVRDRLACLAREPFGST